MSGGPQGEWDQKNSASSLSRTSALSEEEQPKIEAIPGDDWSEIPGRFIGRHLELNDAADALRSVLGRTRGDHSPEITRTVRVIWVHGFGGMGKSSGSLHRARLQAGADVRALIIDWDSTIFWSISAHKQAAFRFRRPGGDRLQARAGVRCGGCRSVLDRQEAPRRHA